MHGAERSLDAAVAHGATIPTAPSDSRLHHVCARSFAPAPTAEPPWVRRLLIALALAFLTLFLFVPLVAVFVEALAKG
ncbi:MAG: hypothetical protein ABIS28_15975, partial [Caldimonas sp.]